MLFIFDMGGVVTTTFKMESLYKYLNLTSEDFFDICKNGQEDIWTQLEKGQIEVRTFWQKFNQLAKNKNVPEVKNDLFRLTFHLKLNEETVKIIKALKKKHRVVCGTNTIQSHWENHTERGDYAFFDQTYASNKINEEKPDVNFFKVILEAENCKPEDAYFVDDKIENVNAALSIGMNAVQFTSASELKKQWKKFF